MVMPWWDGQAVLLSLQNICKKWELSNSNEIPLTSMYVLHLIFSKKKMHWLIFVFDRKK
jgi:hypothetical protein